MPFRGSVALLGGLIIPGAVHPRRPKAPSGGTVGDLNMGGCLNYGPFLGVHIKGDMDIVDVETDSKSGWLSKIMKIMVPFWAP